MKSILLALLMTGQAYTSASFDPDRFQPTEPTDSQLAACMPDAFKYCSHAIPDRDAVKRCMLFNRHHLSPECRGAFK